MHIMLEVGIILNILRPNDVIDCCDLIPFDVDTIISLIIRTPTVLHQMPHQFHRVPCLDAVEGINQ